MLLKTVRDDCRLWRGVPLRSHSGSLRRLPSGAVAGCSPTARRRAVLPRAKASSQTSARQNDVIAEATNCSRSWRADRVCDRDRSATNHINREPFVNLLVKP
jgi:hypothetical protein